MIYATFAYAELDMRGPSITDPAVGAYFQTSHSSTFA
jgi:hypothetical protein